jgi:hypothetical protein
MYCDDLSVIEFVYASRPPEKEAEVRLARPIAIRYLLKRVTICVACCGNDFEDGLVVRKAMSLTLLQRRRSRDAIRRRGDGL